MQPTSNQELADGLADRERVRLRYPSRRTPRWVVVTVVVVLAAGALAWLLWAAVVQSFVPVAGQVTSFDVRDDRTTRVLLTVDRRDPSQPVRCRVIVQGQNKETVGERTVPVGARTERLVNVTVDVTTLRRGTSASVDRCWVG